MQSKRIAAISLFHRGSPREYTLQAEYSGEGKIHRVVQGAESGQKTLIIQKEECTESYA